MNGYKLVGPRLPTHPSSCRRDAGADARRRHFFILLYTGEREREPNGLRWIFDGYGEDESRPVEFAAYLSEFLCCCGVNDLSSAHYFAVTLRFHVSESESESQRHFPAQPRIVRTLTTESSTLKCNKGRQCR